MNKSAGNLIIKAATEKRLYNILMLVLMLMQSEIPKEIAANKLFLQGTDKSGRGLSIMLAGKHDAWYADRNEVLRMLCYSFDAQVSRNESIPC